MKRGGSGGAKRGTDAQQGPGIWLSRGELVQHFELAISTSLITQGPAFEKYKAQGRGFGVGRSLSRAGINYEM